MNIIHDLRLLREIVRNGSKKRYFFSFMSGRKLILRLERIEIQSDWWEPVLRRNDGRRVGI